MSMDDPNYPWPHVPEYLRGVACDCHSCVAHGDICNVDSSEGLVCTLPPMHDGPHVACISGSRHANNHNLSIWTDDDHTLVRYIPR